MGPEAGAQVLGAFLDSHLVPRVRQCCCDACHVVMGSGCVRAACGKRGGAGSVFWWWTVRAAADSQARRGPKRSPRSRAEAKIMVMSSAYAIRRLTTGTMASMRLRRGSALKIKKGRGEIEGILLWDAAGCSECGSGVARPCDVHLARVEGGEDGPCVTGAGRLCAQPLHEWRT